MSAVVAPSRSTVGDGLRDAGTVAWRNLLCLVRDPAVLAAQTIQPVVFVLTFRYVFGGSIFVPDQRYVDYLMPGIFVLTVCFGAINTALGLATDMQTGLIERFRSLPMARSAVLLGRIMADLIRNLGVIIIWAGVGFVVGFRVLTGPSAFVAALALMLVFGVAVSWLLALVGVFTGSPEGANAIAFPLMSVLVFISSAFVLTSRMPTVLRLYAEHQPVTAAVNAARALMFGGPAAGRVAVVLAWTGAISVVFGSLAVIVYRRSAR